MAINTPVCNFGIKAPDFELIKKQIKGNVFLEILRYSLMNLEMKIQQILNLLIEMMIL